MKKLTDLSQGMISTVQYGMFCYTFVTQTCNVQAIQRYNIN